MPVLTALVALLDQSYMVTVSDIAERTGLKQAEVTRSLDAMDPTYVDFRKTETGGDPTFWYVLKVTPQARQAVGQWPTAEGLIDRLAKAFRDAAENEDDPERHYQLRQAAGLLGDSIRDVAVQIAADVTGLSTTGPPATGPPATGSPTTGPSPAEPPADAG
jgi:predicted ArsR family transcriptional regulator